MTSHQRDVVAAASRYWHKIHREGLCVHDPDGWVECQHLADVIEHEAAADHEPTTPTKPKERP